METGSPRDTREPIGEGLMGVPTQASICKKKEIALKYTRSSANKTGSGKYNIQAQ